MFFWENVINDIKFSSVDDFEQEKMKIVINSTGFTSLPSQSMLKIFDVLQMQIISFGVRLSFALPSLAMTSDGVPVSRY